MRLHHQLDGPVGAPVLALPSSLGTTTERPLQAASNARFARAKGRLREIDRRWWKSSEAGL